MTRRFMWMTGAGLFVIAGAALVTTAADASTASRQDSTLLSADADDDAFDGDEAQPEKKKKGFPDLKKKMAGKGFPDLKKKMMFGKGMPDFKKKMPGKGFPDFMMKKGGKGPMPQNFKKKKKDAEGTTALWVTEPRGECRVFAAPSTNKIALRS